MTDTTKVLDHGYVTLIESWGSDERIIEAARMSTNKGFRGWGGTCGACDGERGAYGDFGRGDEWIDCSACKGRGETVGDEKLLRYLWEHNHGTPFEMAGATFEIKAPIFVFREWHRHRTQSYNEMSARYTPLPDENYIPSFERVCVSNLNDENNKQAQRMTPNECKVDDALAWLADLADVYAHAQRVYERGLAIGVPKELARLPVPVARYSRMRASANLRNWLGFLSLRQPSNVQYETRQFANAVHNMLTPAFPRTLALFDEKQPAS